MATLSINRQVKFNAGYFFPHFVIRVIIVFDAQMQ